MAIVSGAFVVVVLIVSIVGVASQCSSCNNSGEGSVLANQCKTKTVTFAKEDELKYANQLSKKELSESNVTNDRECHPWTYPIRNSSAVTCKCGDSLNQAVYCNESLDITLLLACYCMTLDSTGQEVFMGALVLQYNHRELFS